MCAKFLKIEKYSLAPVFFDMVPNKSFAKKGSKSVTVRTSGCEKKHVAVVLTIAMCGDILPPTIIFLGKTDRTIKYLTVPDNLIACIVTQENAWMDEHVMMV